MQIGGNFPTGGHTGGNCRQEHPRPALAEPIKATGWDELAAAHHADRTATGVLRDRGSSAVELLLFGKTASPPRLA